MSHSSESFDLAELQLEQELRQMFEVDSQKDLETYLACVQELQEQTWTADIQTMYRAIHTIKGGSVTVKAEAILQVATVLEDMLSELRYLETIPSLEDGCLKQMLEEGGEIIASVLGTQENEGSAIQAKVARINHLKQEIQANYLAGWSEQTQLQIEFAEQGFDLVILDLEVALDDLPQPGMVPDKTIELARQLIDELEQIGQELEFASGWTTLLENASKLIEQPDITLWKVQWAQYFSRLKLSAKQGGQFISVAKDSEQESDCFSLEEVDHILDQINLLEDSSEQDSDCFSLEEVDHVLDQINLLEDSKEQEETTVTQISELNEVDQLLDNIPLFQADDTITTPTIDQVFNTAKDPLSANEINRLEKTTEKEIKAFEQVPEQLPKQKTNFLEDIQVPIPLTKLDRSAQSIVEILMIVRTMENFYQNLHQNVLKLTGIAKDGVNYLAQLRQIQNDYTLLNQLDRQIADDTDAPALERYRTGYVTINRLLENNLRLSEIGTESEQTAQETAEKLKQLHQSIRQLKDLVEDSRLVPFRSLTFRVKAIVRDLITRYGKSVNFNIQGEQIELDVGTTRRLEPILLHLVRNAYDHGLETSAERVIQGKSAQGNLNLILQRYGNTYTLELQDDGRGIDAQAIQAKAEKLNLPLTRTDTPSELLSVISQAGFSSRAKVSEISGRGVGMDVVAEQMLLLNGSLSLETTLGKGTTFKLNFPVPHLLIPCLLVQSGDRIFAIPTEQIITTSVWESLNATPGENSQFFSTWSIQEGEKTTLGLDLLSYWYPQFGHRTLNSSAIAIYVQCYVPYQGESQFERSGFWLLADKMLSRLELKIQPFPTPLIPPQGLMGVSLQTDTSLIPVIEVNSLHKHIITKLTTVTKTENLIEENHKKIERHNSPTILIVDDAALMRRRIEASLSAYGFTSHSCADGLEAWNWLKINPYPMLIITDIEMPNMDGFTLIDRCRENQISCPILVVSSRLAEEWGKEARRLGATDFLTKGFTTGELINKVNSLMN